MPKLRTYIEAGFCSGYGDGDFRVSAAVENLSRAEMSELINSMFHAQRIAWDMWARKHTSEDATAAKSATIEE